MSSKISHQVAELTRHGKERLMQLANRNVNASKETTQVGNPLDRAPGSVLPDADWPSEGATTEPILVGDLIQLRKHQPQNFPAFRRWYADPEIARLLRHDQRPLNDRQARGYFDAIILPLSEMGYAWALHTVEADELIGAAALTESDSGPDGPLYLRIVIGEKRFWDKGYGTDATRLIVKHGFEALDQDAVKLEVFEHNPRAIRVYQRLGFTKTGDHTEWLGPDQPMLHVLEMRVDRETFRSATAHETTRRETYGEPPESKPQSI